MIELLRQAKTLKKQFHQHVKTGNYQLNLYVVKISENNETNYYQTFLFKISDYMSMLGNLYFKQLIKRMNVITNL